MRGLRFTRSSKVNWRNGSYAFLLLCLTTAIALPAQTFTTLHRFHGTDGANPYAPLVQGTNGDLYGTTYNGGANNGGTVFKITPNGKLTTLYSFGDGEGPYGGLVLAANGTFYGTTVFGGVSGSGTVFSITPSGTLTTLYHFCSEGGAGCTDGENPYGALIQGTDGNFYGTTSFGGTDTYGTVFRITPSGTLTTLYNFCSVDYPNCVDGSEPFTGLVQAGGSFYGTTHAGGYSSSGGTVFKITPSGKLTTLYRFCPEGAFQCTDGAGPEAGLLLATDGNFYGTTSIGGSNNDGTVFKITPSGTLTTLYSFCSQGGFACRDGLQPYAGLIQATDGNLYGTTTYGGAYNRGTAFEITRSGTLTTLYSFCSQSHCPDGSRPYAGLFQATDGNFYGTTFLSWAPVSSKMGGIVYRLSTGLAPFVETLPSFGKVGGTIKILGTNLTGATSVNFGGTPSVFKVISSSLIMTNVPAGASTGSVTVTTPSGTLTSNLPFSVKP